MAGGHGHTHHHGDSHDHEAGFFAWLKGLVSPHSHDTADSVDSALEASKEGMRALKLSLGALLATALAQVVVVLFSGSVALLGDTLHNFADALTAVPLGIAFLVGRRAATSRYTYGYGRAEDIAGLVVVVMIAASAAFAAYESIRRLLEPRQVDHLLAVGMAGIVGFAGNELVARYRISVGRRIGSAALVADGLHARTDGFTSLAVVGGAGGVAAGFDRADPLFGLLITVAILAVLRGAAREVFRRLMDAVDPELVHQAEHVLGGVEGVEAVGGVRLRWIGHSLHAEAEVVVDQDLSVAEGHEISERARHALLHEVRRLTDATIHADPCGHDGSDPHHALSHHQPTEKKSGDT